jgi:glycosyltransferase involved in cell wall biosynthesis
MRELYGQFHLVCQPSRGEGFGFVPLEALATGTPIAATAVTGHSEWFRSGLPGAIKITTGEMAPIDDMVGATAPSLDPLAVKVALGLAYADWRDLSFQARDNARQLIHEWHWANKLGPFVRGRLWEQGE